MKVGLTAIIVGLAALFSVGCGSASSWRVRLWSRAARFVVFPIAVQIIRSTAWMLPTKPSPVVSGETLYMVNDTGILLALEARTGKEKWKESLGDKFAASPILANGMLYLSSEAGNVFVVKPGESYELVSKNKLEGPIRASPAAVGKDFIVRTYTHLYCFGTK